MRPLSRASSAHSCIASRRGERNAYFFENFLKKNIFLSHFLNNQNSGIAIFINFPENLIFQSVIGLSATLIFLASANYVCLVSLQYYNN